MLFDTFFRIERGFKVCCGGNSGLKGSALYSGSRGLGLTTGQVIVLCILGETLYSYCKKWV